MKHILFIVAILTALLATTVVRAQDDNTNAKSRANTFTLGSKGVRISRDKDWNHIRGTWQSAGSEYAMTRIDSNDYVFHINDLRAFYGVGKDTAIQQICLIFKDSLGTMQTSNLHIQVFSHPYAKAKLYKGVVTTDAAQIADSNESVTIHFHPYEDKFTSRPGDRSFRTFNGTIFMYSGLRTSPPYDESNDDGEKEGDFDSHYGILDLGFNTIIDNTNYNSAAAKAFLNVPDNQRNSNLFSLRNGKSINVNIYPFMETFYALKRKNQKINISTGIGLQLYNFRYDNPITYTHSPNGVSVYNPLSAVAVGTTFKKDKLGFDYLNVPLMFTFKTRLHNNHWLVYGVGITAGYSISTWTKQESGEYGKVKDHNSFGFSDFNSCLTGEIGIAPGIRLYGSYQLTNMFTSGTGMEQHPVSFGFRFFAI